MEILRRLCKRKREINMKSNGMKGDIALAFLALILAILGLLTC